jgi:hypothetical protein
MSVFLIGNISPLGEIFLRMVFGVFCCHLRKQKQKSEKLSDFYMNISVGSQQYKRVLLFPYQNSLVAKFVSTVSFFPLQEQQQT